MLILIYSAILPAIILMFLIYGIDQRNLEPKHEVVRMFIMGALVPFPAGLVERQLLVSRALHPDHHGLYPILFTAFFVAGMVEEFLKAGFFQRGIYRHREFEEPIDGVVYAVAVALGFAMVENVLYVTSYGLTVAFLRSITAIPAHMLFGIAMGYYFSLAKMGIGPIHRAYIIPAFLHGIYDSFAMIGGVWGSLALLLFLLFLIGLSFKYIRRLRHAPMF
ncbi:hypothetical protein DNHGIG_19740 [Collibacillus ludicampi]|uniref:Protease PrsW n=1 Tax=Collibacillus ludicampi TaxID=2771369 RepID=A0AAV4LF58_9BACL|nr:PrsW family glutamic-type intramembrane protease [Collibacillus ludicampi]GIM46425.1 hypothetical protein DNHGIG_19740 [Collibacillus ludicampi]